MNHPACALLPILACAATACAPADGVLSLAFELGPPPPSDARVLPPAAELGVPAFELRHARGRCDIDIEAAQVECAIEGLPPLPRPPAGVRVYVLHLLVWHHPVTAGFDARDLGRLPGAADPDFPPPDPGPQPDRERIAVVTPDPLGVARVTQSASQLPLDHVIGAEVLLIPPASEPGGDEGDAAPRSYLVLDGRVGNLPTDDPGRRPPEDDHGDHEH